MTPLSCVFPQEYEGDWEGSNLFANHVAWHKALFLLEQPQNRTQEALDVYDTFLVKDDGKGGKLAPGTPLGEWLAGACLSVRY